MHDEVRFLFHELADLSPGERERVLAERQIGTELRAEIESLLPTTGQFIEFWIEGILPTDNPLEGMRQWNIYYRLNGAVHQVIHDGAAFHARHPLPGVYTGKATTNPVSNSEPPIPKKHEGMALVPSEQMRLIKSATGPWCLPMLLEMSAATGARRGEVMALRWSDIEGNRELTITRSLTQTRQVLEFKGTKSEKPRRIALPESVLAPLAAHRNRQDEFRQQFGPDYRADLDLIFANPDGTLLRPNSISAAVSLLCRRLKLPKGASLHTLRHSHGSFLLANGVDLATVSERWATPRSA